MLHQLDEIKLVPGSNWALLPKHPWTLVARAKKPRGPYNHLPTFPACLQPNIGAGHLLQKKGSGDGRTMIRAACGEMQ